MLNVHVVCFVFNVSPMIGLGLGALLLGIVVKQSVNCILPILKKQKQAWLSRATLRISSNKLWVFLEAIASLEVTSLTHSVGHLPFLNFCTEDKFRQVLIKYIKNIKHIKYV